MTDRMRRVGILGHTGRPGVRRTALALARRLARQGRAVRLDARLGAHTGKEGVPLPALARWCQMLVTLGGDGTAITGARALAGARGVLLPVNLGGLGFLTVAESRELDLAVRKALASEWPVVRRRMLSAVVRRRGRTLRHAVAMNDAVVKGAGGYAAIHVRMAAMGHDLGHLVADGLIAATAAGSTAYSLSAGGPVLAPDVEAMVVTPVCAHSLGSRSLVLAPGTELVLKVLGSFDRVFLLLDGQESVDLHAGDEVVVRLDRVAVNLVQNPDRPFARSLQAKLGWQGSAKRSM
ncbi:MAG: NAD(+)/NADH kinase [Candidatus Eisenbacteria bacterium]|uniref:NAD kinase n=1 Tax=Eiseniibacteriota bacterium TaxID=2212470 RepID=A0A538SGY2_UNCEI|nr:MAG: NAD(+)/NADH kinase [Candidatus Eisenbacteria bacterium]